VFYRLGSAVQLGVARFLRRFLPDPRRVPVEVVDYLAEQLGITDASCIKLYGQRDGPARSHAGEIEESGGWVGFAEVEAGGPGAVDRGAGVHHGRGPQGVVRRGPGQDRSAQVKDRFAAAAARPARSS
jgi:hypothetical protein